MPLRTTVTRLGIAAAGSALAVLAATTPATAGDDGNHRGDHHSDFFKGKVTARSGLILRTAPNRGAAVIRVAPFGEIVKIFCKTPGETVDSNPLWYLLSDGTWAWGAARYIDNIGPAPRWC
ncbi:SH3 domain-containing protein [Streptomyces sp. NPDC002845]